MANLINRIFIRTKTETKNSSAENEAYVLWLYVGNNKA